MMDMMALVTVLSCFLDVRLSLFWPWRAALAYLISDLVEPGRRTAVWLWWEMGWPLATEASGAQHQRQQGTS